jgi:hypothetical protein
MIIDGLLSFSTPATPDNLGLGTGTYACNNILDIGLNGIPTAANAGGARDLGIGDDPALKLMVTVSTAFTSGGAGTLQVNFQGAPDNGSGAPGTWATWYSSPAYALATLTQGARLLDIDWPRPPAGDSLPRFARLTYVIGGAAMTAGAVIAAAVLDRFDQPVGTTNALSGMPAGIYIAN